MSAVARVCQKIARALKYSGYPQQGFAICSPNLFTPSCTGSAGSSEGTTSNNEHTDSAHSLSTTVQNRNGFSAGKGSGNTSTAPSLRNSASNSGQGSNASGGNSNESGGNSNNENASDSGRGGDSKAGSDHGFFDDQEDDVFNPSAASFPGLSAHFPPVGMPHIFTYYCTLAFMLFSEMYVFALRFSSAKFTLLSHIDQTRCD